MSISVRTIVLRVSALSLLLLLILVATITVRTLSRVPNTLLYFVQDGDTNFRLRSVARHLPEASGDERLQATLEALIDGPTESERSKGLSTALPADTRILGLRLLGSELEVDLSRAFTEAGGADIQGRLHQLFYTLTQPSPVEAVSLLIDGVPVTYVRRGGIVVDNPWYRKDHKDLPVW